MLCDYYKDGYCRHHTGSNGSRQLPCIFNTHDSRIEKCKYHTATGVTVKGLRPVILISAVKL